MKLSADTLHAEVIIQSYEAGLVTISGQSYRNSVLLTPKDIISDWQVQRPTDFTTAHFEHIASYQPDVVLIGIGQRQLFVNPALTAPLLECNVGIEVMTTGAACRTFNLLASEGRMVIAGLILN